MALQDQVIPVEFGKGLDTKTDKKAVVPGKLLVLENAVFTEGNQVSKRNGYDSLTNKTFSPYAGITGTLAGPKMVKSFNNETIVADSGRLWSYSPTLAAWVDKGPYESVASSQQLVSTSGSGASQTYQSQAVLGNYMLCTWQELDQNTSTQAVFACILDTTTGVKVFPDTILADGTKPFAVVLGGVKLAVIFNATTVTNIVTSIFTISGNTVVVAAPVTTVTDLVASGGYRSYDCVSTVTGAVLSYSTATTLKTALINTSGAVTSSATITTSCNAISITLGNNANIWVYGCTTGSAGTFYYAVYSSTLSVVLAKTNIATVPASHFGMSIGAIGDSSTQQTVVYAQSTGNPGASVTTDSVTTASVTVTSAGVVTAAAFAAHGPYPITKPFLVNSTHYIIVASPAGTSNVFFTYFLFNMDSRPTLGSTVSGYAAAKGEDGIAQLLNNGTTQFAEGFLQTAVTVSSTLIRLFTGYLSADSPSAQTSSTTLQFDYNSQDAYQGLLADGQLILNGGIVHMYDGNYVSELNFNNFPSILAAFDTGTGNIPSNGFYEFIALYQWVDALGNLHSSAVSSPVTPSFTTGNPMVTLEVDISVPLITSKDPLNNGAVIVSLYMTPSTSINYYLVGSKSITAGVTVVSFTVVNAATSGNAPAYTNGAVLSNDPPPPSLILNTHNNRVWAVDSTDPNTVWYSKTAQKGVGISFTGNLTATVDSKGGYISGLAELDDKEILFKSDSRVVVFFGDGENDTGTGSTLSPPVFIQTDVGCQYSKSVFTQPNGVLFKTPKGWYLLDRSTQVSYIGAPVEAFNAQDVTSAVRIKDKTQIRFLTSGGAALVYDYFFDQWGTFTNHAGYSADICNGLYTYVRTDSAVYTENQTGTYLDSGAAYKVRARFSYLKLSGLQGFQRVRKIMLLGDHASPSSGHGVQMSVSYDYTEIFTPVVAYPFTTTSGTTWYQYKENLPQQKCEALSVLIEETTTGASGEYIDFTDISFEAGMKKGTNKLPASQTVG